MGCRLALVVGLLSLFGFPSGAWADGINLIQNPIFTLGTVATSFCTNSTCVTDNLPVDWGNLGPNPDDASNVNVVTTGSEPITAPAGYAGEYVAFSSTATVGQDCLFQDVPTTPGAFYTWAFQLAIVGSSSNLILLPEWDANGSNDTVYIGVGNGTYSTASFGGQPVTSSGNVPFQQFSFQVQATLSTTRLFFHGVDNGGAVLVADVSLTQQSATPEPASLWLLSAGFITILLAAAARKKLQPKTISVDSQRRLD